MILKSPAHLDALIRSSLKQLLFPLPGLQCTPDEKHFQPSILPMAQKVLDEPGKVCGALRFQFPQERTPVSKIDGSPVVGIDQIEDHGLSAAVKIRRSGRSNLDQRL